MDDYSLLVQQLNLNPNLHFVFREDDLEKTLEKPIRHLVEMALRKACLYSDKAIVVRKPTMIFSFWGVTQHSPISKRLTEIYEQFEKNTTFEKIFYFVPETIRQHGDQEGSTEVFDFSNEYKHELSVDFTFNSPVVNSHIFETLHCHHNELKVTNIWLPELTNVPLDILLKLREDEQDSFMRFHKALKELIVGLGKADDTKKAIEIFQKVDYEVRMFDEKINQIKRMRTLKAMEAGVGITVMGLCLALPSEISKIIMSVIGTYEAKEFIGYLFQERERLHDLKTSDFYVPWLCTAQKK